jgi:hypothetical protein
MKPDFDLSRFYVIRYEHIDDTRCHRPLNEAFEHLWHAVSAIGTLEERTSILRKQLSTLFTQAGWEGDGEIGCFFIPPPFTGRDDTWCEIIFHVKQSNNGTSFIAIPNRFEPSLPRRN